MIFKTFVPAQLYKGKNRWYVLYYALNPQTGKLHRKEIRINRIRSLSERKRYALKLIAEINSKLYQGWNPFLEQEAPRAFTKLTEAADTFLKAKTKEFSSADSIRTYASYIQVLKDFIVNVEKTPDILVINFDAFSARRYADYLYNERNLSGRTFNNYKAFSVLLWNWFTENLYTKTNPFLTVKKKLETAKTRTIIDPDTLKRITERLTETNETEYLTIVLLCFHGLIRPKEICFLKPEYFDIEKRVVVLPAEITKDKDRRVVTLSDELTERLEQIGLRTMPKGKYVFSAEWKPGKVLRNSRDVGKRWAKLRTELDMPAEYQFYSLKDTGIVQMLQNGVNPLDVRNQAGHASLEQTNAYAKYVNPEGSDQIRKLFGK